MKGTPGFAAEDTLYKTSEQYRLSAGHANYADAQMIFPSRLTIGTLGVNCSGSDGSNCYCGTAGCKQVGGTCCCLNDQKCIDKTGIFGFGVIAHPGGDTLA